MPRPRRIAASVASLFLFFGAGCSLLKIQVTTSRGGGSGSSQEPEEEPRARRNEAEERRQAEERRLAEYAEGQNALVRDIERLRAEVAAGGPDKMAKSKELAKLIIGAEGHGAAKDGRLDMAKLSRESAGHLEQALAADASMEIFDLMLELPPGPEVDAAVVRACAKVRPKISTDEVPNFVEICLERADGDVKKLKWASVQGDVAAYRKADDARKAAEAKAKAEQAKVARYVAAAVFASGRCNFSNCLKDGWTSPSPEGDIQVRCDFQDCFKNGWTARYPDGGEAHTRCSFQNCIKDGWETSYPDGEVARTRCSFQNCLRDGWETDLPGGGRAQTRCSFQDCSKDGWETDLPGGSRVQCRCNFQKCFENGASCG
jgi:hypothetical protein